MNLQDATILVVDDEPELLEIFAIWLGRSGCTVLKAPNGAEGLKILMEQKVDALISDIRMPVMDGVTLVRRLHELKHFLPSIIFVSGFGDINVRDVHSLGVEAMLPKPLSRHMLLRALEDSLKSRESLWLTPLATAPEHRLELELPSLSGSANPCSFRVGRGGCCFTCADPLEEDTEVELNIRFAEEGVTLSGQGRVRWYDSKERRMGIEFLYLQPECRDWVIGLMEGDAKYSFIPRC